MCWCLGALDAGVVVHKFIPGKRIILVLGMHRSGTSAVTRGLEVLGVNLGDRLMPALPGVNEKGFYEDLDVFNLNVALLKELGHDWHTLKPIGRQELLGQVAERFYVPAINIIKRKIQRTNVFGVKDPRISRLLPFWQEVFKRMGLRVDYVVAFRNPLSVVSSLSKRDGLDATKAYFLWFEEMLSCMLNTQRSERVVVDYDQLMDDPAAQLSRVANEIGLVFKPESKDFIEYKEEFLNGSLRHSSYSVSDLEKENTPSRNIIQLYTMLSDAANDQMVLDQAEEKNVYAAMHAWLIDLCGTLSYICISNDEKNTLRHELGRRDAELKRLKQVLADAGKVHGFAGEAEFREQAEPVSQVESWLKYRLPTPKQNTLISQYLDAQAGGPSFGIVILDLDGDSARLMSTIKSLSLEKSLYATLKMVVLSVSNLPETTPESKLHFIQVVESNHVSVLNTVVQNADFDWVMIVKAGEEFTPSGLMIAALELISAPECRAIYGDEIQRAHDGSLGAAFRPAFNLDMLLSFPAGMAHHWLFRRDLVLESGGFNEDLPEAMEFDLILRLVESEGLTGLGHVNEPLLITDATILCDNHQEQQVIESHLIQRGFSPKLLPAHPGHYRIDYGHAYQPLVSVIIYSDSRLELLRRCVESLLDKTRYQHYEIVIVEGDSESKGACAWLNSIESLGEEKLRVVRGNGCSPSINQIVSVCRGEYLLLLGCDTAIVQEDWLDALLNHAQRGEVGVVGAKLLYPNGLVCHAGLVLGLGGIAGRQFEGEAITSPGYMQRLHLDQNLSAVSSACLMIRKSIFEAIGGIDTSFDSRECLDVDLCLRVREAGYLTVWTPHAVLMQETVQDNKSTHDADGVISKQEKVDQDNLYKKWLPILARDPAYNANLSLHGKGFELEPELNISWRPLTWNPLPTILAHPADPFGCGNYRVIQPFRSLRHNGIIEGILSPGLFPVMDLERYAPDVIVLQRQIGDERLDAMRRIKLLSQAFKVYELDDYLPNLPSKSVHRKTIPKDALRALRKGLSYVDRFVVSTQTLADEFHGLHDDIRVVENRLPMEWWGDLPQSKRRGGRKPRVGWAGGASHTGDLELIADVVMALVDEVDWVFFGMCPDKIKPYVQEFHPGVDIDAYPKALAALDLDLALAPLENNQFNRCKSNLRLLEYGICGFPVVCTDLVCYEGDFPVTRVRNRFKDWVDAIRMHVNDLDASARLGDELKIKIQSGWMLDGENLNLWRDAWLP
jgi:GT2 family glycosyltransferase